MSWWQLKSSPPDPRSLSNIEYNDINNTNNNNNNNNNNHGNNETTNIIRNYNMNDNENYNDKVLQQRIESHLLPLYHQQQQQHQQQNRSSNIMHCTNHQHQHPSYRSFEHTVYNHGRECNTFFDYNATATTRRMKLPILSPIETSRMHSMQTQENNQVQQQQRGLLLQRSQMDSDNIKSDNACSNDMNHSSNMRMQDSIENNQQQQERSKKKKYSRLEIIQAQDENPHDGDELAPRRMNNNTSVTMDSNSNNDTNIDANKTKKSNTSLTEEEYHNDQPVTKKTRTKKNNKSKDSSSRENNRKSKTKKKTKTTDKSSKKQKKQQTLEQSLSIPESSQQQQQQQQPRIRSKKNRKNPPLTLTNKPFIMTEDMFSQIEKCNIFNAGASNAALDSFYSVIQNITEKDYIAWTIVFYDECLTTTSFEPLCKKFCTKKGPVCQKWNCTCDNQIRAVQANKPLFGAMFVVSYPNIETGKMCFVVPLGPTSISTASTTNMEEDDEGLFDRISKWPTVPFNCGATLKRRWDIIRKIILQKHKKLITYNAVMSLMVLHYHKIHDLKQESMDLMITSTWDLRLASWILRPHAKEEELEFDTILQGFPHIKQKILNEIIVPNNASLQLQSLVKIRQHLECIYALHPIIDKVLLAKSLHESFYEIESPLQSILAALECQGVGFLPNRLRKRQEKLERRIDELITNARHIAADPNFLLSSPQQVSHLLFNILKIPFPIGIDDYSKGKNNSQNNNSSSSQQVLEAILAAGTGNNPPHDIINIILEFRNLNKLLTSFILPLPALAVDANNDRCTTSSSSSIHRIHPMWQQTAVRTGRLSCRKPNMQQIPTSTTLGISPRDSFCASSKEMCLFACDYCQNEIRILAHMSNDPQLISLFHEDGHDIYKQMSSSVTGKPLQEVTDKERSVSKQVTLAIIYGMGIQQVSKKLKISQSEAKILFNKFFTRFSGVRTWINQTKDFARKNKFVLTIVGRRRYLDDICSNDSAKRSQAERQAVNTIIQGSAADLMKLAMLKMSCRILDWKKEICSFENGGMVTGIAPKLVLQIHDELLFEVSTNETDVHLLKDIVERCCAEECERDLKLKVPLRLKFHVGISWGENMKEL